MDIHMDLQVGFDDDFSFGSRSLPCSSSSGSFSSESTTSSKGPFTPISGRSTPGLQPLLMDHDNMLCGTSAGFCLTPPASAFTANFPSEAKSDASHYMGYESLLETPSRKPSVQLVAMDFDCASMMPTPAVSRNNSIQSTNPRSLRHNEFDEGMISPLEFPPAPFPLDSSAYDMAPSWSWPGESPVNFFEMQSSSPGIPTSLQEMSMRDPHYSHSSYFPGHEKRRLYVDGVQQKTTALHQVQHGFRVSKRTRPQKTAIIGQKPVLVLPKGAHHCPHDICVDRKPFKRQEHLKRHLNTVHGDQEKINIKCDFCSKVFNRRDNWRSHLALHTRQPPNHRTSYHEEAQALLDEEMRKTKQRNQPKKKLIRLKAEDD
ncbi:hypothetical protein F4861DRAFT_163531 [Xylaria intraflava]|nr:hypothetical protein F4861DRAFT_163531 [Xylaria intraflava]